MNWRKALVPIPFVGLTIANKQFIEKLINEEYSIIDIGSSYNSHFYDMESSLLENLLWEK